jgi:hypothetical protein
MHRKSLRRLRRSRIRGVPCNDPRSGSSQCVRQHAQRWGQRQRRAEARPRAGTRGRCGPGPRGTRARVWRGRGGRRHGALQATAGDAVSGVMGEAPDGRVPRGLAGWHGPRAPGPAGWRAWLTDLARARSGPRAGCSREPSRPRCGRTRPPIEGARAGSREWHVVDGRGRSQYKVIDRIPA